MFCGFSWPRPLTSYIISWVPVPNTSQPVTDWIFALQRRGSKRLQEKLDKMREQEAVRQMADMMAKAIARVSDLERQATATPPPSEGDRGHKAAMAEQEERLAMELEAELRTLQAEIGEAAAALRMAETLRDGDQKAALQVSG